MMMDKLKNDFNVKKLYIAWDGKDGPNWRKEILPEYKANRKPREKILIKIIDKASSYFGKNGELINICFLEYEADDVIYALCRLLNNHKIIVSADKDFIQVVQEGLAESVFNPMTKTFRKIPKIDSVIEKAICGDSSDNLKGIPGCGPKSVEKLINNQMETLTKKEIKIFEKHIKVIGLRENPYKNKILEDVDKYLYVMEKGV
jgi:DNA polymerase-1